MEESGDKQEENCTFESANQKGLSIDKIVAGTDSLDPNRVNDRSETGKNAEKSVECSQMVDGNSSPSKSKESVTGAKVKRKLRSTRRKLNAMINNTSLHFSDTDSEGELTSINSQIRSLSYTADEEQGPIISVTSDDVEAEGSKLLSPDDKGSSQPNNFIENLTDVDEIYASEPENERKEDRNNLKVGKTPCQGDTDLEDFEGEDEVHSMIYVKPRCDIFCDYSGETITTKEGDGPFSVEVRNKMYREEEPRNGLGSSMPDIVVMSNTDEEDMDISEEEDMQEACCSHKELLEDLDVLAASQVIMRNINKMENTLTVKDIGDDAISDCHTDIEEVDPNE